MDARGALLLGGGLLDDRTLRIGDGAEKLTSGVATKGVESSILTRVMKEEQYYKAVLEDQVDLFSKQPPMSDRARLGILSWQHVVAMLGRVESLSDIV